MNQEHHDTLENLTEPLTPNRVSQTIQSAARKAAGTFYGYVPFEDMLQQAHLSTLEHPHKFREHVDNGDDRRLFGMLYKDCSLYGQKVKASALGYRVEDLFFYSKKALRSLLPLLFAGEVAGDTDASLDVHTALMGLPTADFQILWWTFYGDMEEEAGYALVASRLGISTGAARSRVDRVLRRLQDVLGGENPTPRRTHRQSNAAAIAEIRSAWDGEG